MAQREWKRGDKAAKIEKFVLAYLTANLSATLVELCTEVMRRISEEGLDIDVRGVSSLKTVLMAEKRPFNYAHIDGQGTVFTLKKEILMDLVDQMVKKSNKAIKDNLTIVDFKKTKTKSPEKKRA